MRKIIALGIMLLFLGMSISSTTGIYLEKQTIEPISFGNILYVGGNGTGNYSKIQDAINDSSDGDTIYVYNGTYYENLIVSKSINLIGENKDTTIIDGNEIGDVVYVSADWVNIIEFTIKNGSNGIYLDDSHYNFISSNIISNNNKDGIYLRYSDNNIINQNNITSNIKFGVSLIFSNKNRIKINNIIGNSIGICSSWKSIKNNISNNIISENEYTGVLLHDSHENKLDGNIIKYNSGSGVSLTDSSNTSLIINIISYNTYSNIKIISSSDINISYSFISAGCYEPYGGVGIYLCNAVDVTIYANEIFKNFDGILIANSSYINITKNLIHVNGEVGIDIFSKSSNNTIARNWINSNKCGIYIGKSNDNKIIFNTFKENKIHAFFRGCKNIWENNYWNRIRFLPKPIFGLLDSRGLKSLIPQVQFDWHPAKEPYDIEV